MKRFALFLAAAGLFPRAAVAHPGSGIVVDRLGQVYFVDTGSGVWKIDAHGVLTKLPGPMFHWMALDADNRFGTVRLPSGSGWEIDRVEADPTLLVASDFPLVIGGDGSLYYPSPAAPRGVELMRMLPSGGSSVVARLPLPWLNGLAAGPNGSLYYTEDRAVRRLSPDGRVSAVIENLALTGCATIPGNDASAGAFLRGLAVDAEGTTFVAASGCGSVLKISAQGRVTKLLQLQAPWSPTAVALFGSDVYVLEYLHTANESRREWVPRVRKLTADGRNAIIATVERP